MALTCICVIFASKYEWPVLCILTDNRSTVFAYLFICSVCGNSRPKIYCLKTVFFFNSVQLGPNAINFLHFNLLTNR